MAAFLLYLIRSEKTIMIILVILDGFICYIVNLSVFKKGART